MYYRLGVMENSYGTVKKYEKDITFVTKTTEFSVDFLASHLSLTNFIYLFPGMRTTLTRTGVRQMHFKSFSMPTIEKHRKD